jgi:hypothetical protein
VNDELTKTYAAELQSYQQNIEEELQLADAAYQTTRESEIRALLEQALSKFTDEYYSSHKQAMIDTVDLTIRKEKTELLHQRQLELLPLSTSLTLDIAHQALDKV